MFSPHLYRDILREIILKSCLYDRAQFNKELLTSDESMLRILDDHHMARVTLNDAMNTKNMDVLNVALAHSTPILTRRDAEVDETVCAEDKKLVDDANKLYTQLLRRKQASEQAALAATGKGKSKAAAPAVVDKVIGDVEKITNSFHAIAPMHTAVVRPAQSQDSSAVDLSLRVDDDDEHIDQLRDCYVKVPLIVYDCIQYLRQHDAIEEVGIFRQAGSRDAMEEILAKYEDLYVRGKRRGGIIQEDLSKTFIPPPVPVSPSNTRDRSDSASVSTTHTAATSTSAAAAAVAGGATPSVASTEAALPSIVYDSFQSVHDAANILKRFFRELSDPLIPYSDYEKWLAVAAKCRSDPLLSSGSTINASGGTMLNMTSRALTNSIPISSINSGLASFSFTSPGASPAPMSSPVPLASPAPVSPTNSAPALGSIQAVSCSLKEVRSRRYISLNLAVRCFFHRLTSLYGRISSFFNQAHHCHLFYRPSHILFPSPCFLTRSSLRAPLYKSFVASCRNYRPEDTLFCTTFASSCTALPSTPRSIR